MPTLPRLAAPLLLLALVGSNASAQGMPTAQPGVLTINIEELKVGMSADHAAHEAGWPAAFARASYPHNYLAMESLTGTPEVWFLLPYASFSAEGEGMKFVDDNQALSAEMAKLARGDAQYLESYRSMQMVARPDLSYGQFPDMAMVRFYEVTTFRVRPGHEQGWEAAAKVYRGLVERAMPGMSYRTYQVVSGMPGGTYVVFASVNSYAEFDRLLAEGMAMWQNVSPQDMATLQQTMANDVMSVTTNRYRVSPTMSYVDAKTKAKAPDFWK
jgi:hypothetical protein